MTLPQALDLVLSLMEYGECRAITKDDIKFRVYEVTGHYPRSTEFDKAFDNIRTPHNKYDLVYKAGIGWYRATTYGLDQYAKRLDNQITKRKNLKNALR